MRATLVWLLGVEPTYPNLVGVASDLEDIADCVMSSQIGGGGLAQFCFEDLREGEIHGWF